MKIKYEEITKNEEIKNYIFGADKSLASLGYTDHGLMHASISAKVVKDILENLDYSKEEIELGQIAAYMHDIGNVINRENHAQTGAIMAFRILDKLGMDSDDIIKIISAIGNHDEGSGYPVNEIAAALIIADKTDVRRSRVRNPETYEFNIHDRVNYAVKERKIEINKEKKIFTLTLKIDTKICDVMDYFTIFIERMDLCKKAAKKLNMWFKLIINDLELI